MQFPRQLREGAAHSQRQIVWLESRLQAVRNRVQAELQRWHDVDRNTHQERTMRGLRTTALALGLCLAGAAPVCAGVYNTAEPDWPSATSFYEFRLQRLVPLKQIGAVDTPLHKRYALMAELAARGVPDKMTAEDRLNLSAYLIRIRQYRQAIDLLEAAVRKERRNPLLYANLALAQFLEGVAMNTPDLARRAEDNQAEAVRLLPVDWQKLGPGTRTWLVKIGWDEKQYQHYRAAETYLLKLMRLRTRGVSGRPEVVSLLGKDVEPLFTDGGKPPRPVRFVGESARYEPGKIAKAEAAKLPPNAVEIVEQLLIWMPHDDRLFWLLGELFNARGEYGTALEIFNDVARKLQGIRLGGKAEELDPAYPDLPELHREHVLAVRTAKEKADAEAFKQPAPELPVGVAQPAAVGAKGPPPAASGTLPIDLRSLGVGFGVGLLVAVLGYWQLREIRRRVQARAAPAPPAWRKPDEAITVKREGGRTG
jgi:tetratricopeptide (TPR) repeat protein